MSKDWGSKPGSGGVASGSVSNVERRERLRQLALETVDLAKDPYFMKNHLGSYECKLCLTLHTNEGSYLAHTQGKRHQQNLARRAAKKAAEEKRAAIPIAGGSRQISKQLPKTPKIGIPEHYVFKVRNPQSGQPGLIFILKFTRILDEFQPRTRFMSAVEQKIENPDLNYQYVLFAAEPYNTIGFKIPNMPIDREPGKFISEWSSVTKTFTFQFHFLLEDQSGSTRPSE